MGRAGIRSGRGVGGCRDGNGHEIHGGVRSVCDGQLEHKGACDIGGNGGCRVVVWRDVREDEAGVEGLVVEHPGESEGVAVRVGGARAVQLHSVAKGDGLVRASIRGGGGIERRRDGDGHGGHIGVGSVIHGQSQEKVALRIGCEVGLVCEGIGEIRIGQKTGGRNRIKGPQKGQRIAIGVGGARAVQLHGFAEGDVLGGTSIGRWRCVGGSAGDGDGHRVRALEQTVSDTEPHHIGALQVRRKAGGQGEGAGEICVRKAGACRDRHKRPLLKKGVPVRVKGACSVQLHGAAQSHRLVGARVRGGCVVGAPPCGHRHVHRVRGLKHPVRDAKAHNVGALHVWHEGRGQRGHA